MAGSRTSLGSGTTKGGDEITIPGVSIAAGESLLIAVFAADTGNLNGATLDGNSLTAEGSFAGTGFNLFLITSHNSVPMSGTISITFDNPLTWGVAVAEKLRGAKASPADVAKDGLGTGTSPTSGATGTPSQASMYVLGIVATNGPSGDAAGTWSNSFTASQRAGTTGGTATDNGTLSLSFKILSAAAAQTAAKTGITSRDWMAAVATYKLVDDVAATLGKAVAVGTALPIVPSDPAVLAYNPTDAPAVFVPDPDPWNPATQYTVPQTIYVRSASAVNLTPTAAYVAYIQNHDMGLCSSNGPYQIDDVTLETKATKMAHAMARQQSAIVPYLFLEQMSLSLAIDALPVARQSSEEVNYLLAYHEVGGRMLYGLGFTPSGRIVFQSAGLPDVITPINTIKATDHEFHQVYCYGSGTDGQLYRVIYLDGKAIVSRTDELSDGANHVFIQNIPVPVVGTQSRIMFLNGPDGLTRMSARISRFSPCRGLEYVVPRLPGRVLAPTTNTTGLNCDLDASFVTPLPVTPFGPVPNVDPESLLIGWSKTPYIPRPPVNPTYTPVPR